MGKINISHVDASKLRPSEYNPRKLSDKEHKDLKRSIKEFGLVDPLIINEHPDRENIVIGGHQRLKISKELEIEEVPVVYVDLDKEREKELNLRLNKNTGSWDFEKLQEFDLDNLIDVGFDDDDLSEIWDDVLSIHKDEFDVEEELNEINEPDSSPGDLYELGPHRLLCGNSADVEVVKKLVGNNKIDTIYCDPPFNINLDYNGGIGGNQNYGGNIDDDKNPKEYKEFLKKTIKNALSVSRDDVHVFYYCDQSKIQLVQSLFEKLGLKNRRICLWIKNGINPTPDVAFNKSYEACVYATKGKPNLNPKATKLSEILNKEIDTGNRTHDDIKDLWDIWLAKRKAGQDYQHSAHKPVTLHEKPIRRVTKPGDTILDLFGGSGSSLIGAEQMNRKCFMVELEPVFTDLIIKRYEKLTGNKAKKIN